MEKDFEKIFEALERLKTAPSFMGGTEKYRFSMNSASVLLEDYDLVKQAITELEAIKKAKPNEALECIDYIENKLGSLRVECEKHHNHSCDDLFIQEHIFTTIKQFILKAQSQEKELAKYKKAWEIVKDCFSVREYQKGYYDLVNECSDCRESIGDIPKEEYDLLKEMKE